MSTSSSNLLPAQGGNSLPRAYTTHPSPSMHSATTVDSSALVSPHNCESESLSMMALIAVSPLPPPIIPLLITAELLTRGWAPDLSFVLERKRPNPFERTRPG